MFNLLGTIVNAIAIVVGSLVGIFIKRGLPDNIKETVMKGLALCVLYLGFSGTLKGNNPLLMILSIVIGGVVGEAIDIDKAITKLGNNIEKRFKGGESKISQGFVASSLLFCVGSMAIVGSLESGLTGNHQMLYAKSILDGVSSIIFSSTLGIGVMISAISVFIYQGFITICAALLKGILLETVVANMTAIGSLLIIGIGLNMLGITKIKVANLLPAVFIPIIYQLFIR
ncbi:DUF554 domain-containing protein [Caloramator sp. ALD01]|uniref:DUF554 domain-containing protein n=1 Tax=Caloramator sp. ALD01 TaxID=1031288 RepID=UPI0003F8AB4C|nr:DUF554 domain-containing protein [Caloramator sp. ALD01]